MHWHSCRERGLWRGWLYYGRKNRTASLEVSWGGSLCHFTPIDIDDENGLGFSVAVPGLAIFVHSGLLRFKEDRDISIRFHDWAVWWRFWTPTMSWSSTTPRWRDGSFHYRDWLLGRPVYSARTIEERDVVVPMPERGYPAKAKLLECTWTRPRWFAETIRRVEIEIENGIPFPGKGENSWDCGDDATYSIMTGPCRTIAEGVGVLVGSVLERRVRHGGWREWTWKREAA